MKRNQMPPVRQVARDAIVRVVAIVAARRGIKILRGLGKLVLEADATRKCHEDAITLLKAWMRWSAIAGGAEPPTRLVDNTIQTLTDHGVRDVTTFTHGTHDQTGEDSGAQTERSASDSTHTDRK